MFNAPVIFNHYTPPHPATDFFSFLSPGISPTICWDKLMVMTLHLALLNLMENSIGGRIHVKTPVLLTHCEDNQKVIALHLSPAVPHQTAGGSSG